MLGGGRSSCKSSVCACVAESPRDLRSAQAESRSIPKADPLCQSGARREVRGKAHREPSSAFIRRAHAGAKSHRQQRSDETWGGHLRASCLLLACSRSPVQLNQGSVSIDRGGHCADHRPPPPSPPPGAPAQACVQGVGRWRVVVGCLSKISWRSELCRRRRKRTLSSSRSSALRAGGAAN